MKRIVLAAVAACIALTVPAMAGEIRLASDVWPPFTDVPGQPRIAIDLVEEALERAGFTMKNRIVGFDAVLAGLESGAYDGSAAFWRSPERERFLLYSRAYLENRLVLVGRKDTDVGVTSLADLAGKKIAVVEGYAYGDEVAEGIGPIFVEGRNDQLNFRLLLDGGVDYLLVDELLVHHLLTYQGPEARANLAIGTVPLIRHTLHFVVKKDFEGAQEMVDRFDAAIGQMLGDGTFNRILGLNWIRADVDGDGQLEMVYGGLDAGEAAPADGYEIAYADGGAEAGQSEHDRYWIQGQAYDSWNDVPERYKYAAPRGNETQDPGMNLFKLDF